DTRAPNPPIVRPSVVRHARDLGHPLRPPTAARPHPWPRAGLAGTMSMRLTGCELWQSVPGCSAASTLPMQAHGGAGRVLSFFCLCLARGRVSPRLASRLGETRPRARQPPPTCDLRQSDRLAIVPTTEQPQYPRVGLVGDRPHRGIAEGEERHPVVPTAEFP